MSNPCTWKEDANGLWDTDCDQMHEFYEGGPSANEHRFCPYCGLSIVETPYQEDDEEEERRGANDT